MEIHFSFEDIRHMENKIR